VVSGVGRRDDDDLRPFLLAAVQVHPVDPGNGQTTSSGQVFPVGLIGMASLELRI
jgi:hypothetical protein